MSDHPSCQDALSVRLGVRRCTGAPGCPCESSTAEWSTSSSSSSGRSDSAHSPSGSRTRSSHGAPSGSTSNQEPSESSVPEGIPVQEWSGLQRVEIGKCHHGRLVVLKKCCEGEHTGRRFLGCPLEDEEDQCQFKEWVEGPWPERVQACLKDLWKELKTTRRCEANANSSMIEALQIKEIATKANANLVKKVTKTMNIAHAVCKHYYDKATKAHQEKEQLQILIYCLLGVIAFLLAVLVYLVK